jgi:hypothetical protein
VRALLQCADQDEEAAGGEAVADHLHGRSAERQVAARVGAHQHQAEVAHARVGDQPLQVTLAGGEQRAVEDAGRAEPKGGGRQPPGRVGEERERQAQKTVAAGLQQQPGQHHAAARGRLGVSVREPGVQRDYRQLDGEGGNEAQHQRELDLERQAQPAEGGQVEGEAAGDAVMEEGQADNGEQHQQPAGLRKDHELERRPHPVLVPPDANQEDHGDQHQLPADEEEKEVGGEEDTEHTGEHPEEVEVVEADPLAHFGPGGAHREQPQKQSEQAEEQAEPVEAKLEAGAKPRDPGQ